MPVTHTVQEGECLDVIAFQYGFFPDAIWDLSENSDLRSKRTSMSLLVPGDQVFIPDLRVKEESCATEAKHSFRRKGVPSRFQVRFTDGKGEALAGVSFRTIIDEEFGPEGKTDGDGVVDIVISPDAENLKLILDTEVEWAKENDFVLSNLRPADTIEGLQARLFSLGFYRGEVDGEDSEDLHGAIASFAADGGLTLPADPTAKSVQDAVVDAYGC